MSEKGADGGGRTASAGVVPRARLLIMPRYKPGDLPPEGYLQWHEWADVQRKAGIKQVECPRCGLWRTPQELSTHELTWTLQSRRGAITQSAFLCAKCFAKNAVLCSNEHHAPEAAGPAR